MQRWTRYCHDLYVDLGGRNEIVKELEFISACVHEYAADILY